MEPKAIYRLECDSLERPTTGVGYFSNFCGKAKVLADQYGEAVTIKKFIIEDKEWITIWSITP